MAVETIPNARPQYSVRYSDEDNEWLATTPTYPSLSWLAGTPEEALAGLQRLIDEARSEIAREQAAH
ncbi:hypothetical protein [Gordonia rhizosphera]|nr:hypothetical protein [Gordonia rhizosphera]